MSAGATPSTDLLAIPTATPRARAWGSRWVEFLLVGGATLVLFPVSWLLQRAIGLDSTELAAGFLTFYAAYVINDPHFTVTYFLFYRDARRRAFGPEFGGAQRVRYWIAGVVVPVALAVWAVVALATHSAPLLGWMMQLMFLLVGWHYVKQGFGVLTVLSARRGVRMTARERAAFLAHCFAAWAYAWANPAAPAGEYEERGVVFWAIAHPRWLELVAGTVLGASAIALGIVLVGMWRRERKAFPSLPVTAFLITVWSWTIYTSVDPLIQYAIPALHAIQYFYFVWLMRRNEARSMEGPPTFGRPAGVRIATLALGALTLGWLLFRGIPTFLDDALVPHKRHTFDPLGETPFFAAFFVFVNIHHYFMDHVIWRRENPETRFLRITS